MNIWQYRSNDHIIRNRQDYDEHLRYIYENPMRWYYDELYADSEQIIEVNPLGLLHPHAGKQHTAQFPVREAKQFAVEKFLGKVSNLQGFFQLVRVRLRPCHVINVAVRLQEKLFLQQQVTHQRGFLVVQADESLLEERSQRMLDFPLHRFRHRDLMESFMAVTMPKLSLIHKTQKRKMF